MTLIEGDVVELGFLLGHHSLHADGVVLVDVEIIDVNLAINSDCSEDCGAVGSPGNISHLSVQIKHEQRLAEKVENILENSF